MEDSFGLEDITAVNALRIQRCLDKIHIARILSFQHKDRTSGLINLTRCFIQTSASTRQRVCGMTSWDNEDVVKATVSDITGHFSQKPVLHFYYSNHYV